MRTLFVVVCALILSGCAAVLPPSQLEPPASRLMAPPPALHDLKPGDDLVPAHAELRRAYATETDKYRRLQKYVRTILKK